MQAALWRRAAIGCAIAMVLGLLAPAAHAQYRPPDGVVFNRPARSGTVAQMYAMRRHTEQAINATRRGATIRVAQYAINFRSTADAFIRAYRRGVNVQILVDDRHNYGAHRRLRAALGSNKARDSYFAVCVAGCRIRGGGALHSKFLTFSSTGTALNVVMVSSANLTGPGATWGWNDNVTWTGRPVLYKAFVQTFEEMRLDKRVNRPFRVVSDRNTTAYFHPQPRAKLTEDPQSRALSTVRCRSGSGPTVIRVAMFGIIGTRGVHLARKLHALDNAGCRVEVIIAKPSRKAIIALRKPGRFGGITVHDSRYDRDGDGRPDKYVHHKFMIIKGHVYGNPNGRVVFTGSQNWFPRSQTHDDEIVVRMMGAGMYNRYEARFLDIFRNHSYLRKNKVFSFATLSPAAAARVAEDLWPDMGPLPEVE